ncbi:MAG TPA: hypothetical protein VHM90_15595 [Phycisphaerae bacterium]|nr:hypothetical protein [Phycisphaerae bacterium]
MITTANTHATMNRLQQKKTFLGTSPSFIAYNQTYNIATQVTALMTAEGTSSFTYDNDGQILTVSAGAMTSSESYSFDASGNRNSTGYTTGTDNQMTSAPNLSATTSHYEFAYDHEGNTTDRWTKTGTASTEHVVDTWDFRNRLAEVQTYTVIRSAMMMKQIMMASNLKKNF